MTSMTAQLSDARASPPAPTPGIQIQPTGVTTARPAVAPQPTDSAAQPTVKPVTVDLPEVSGGKLHLSLDRETGRVVSQVVDRDSGKLLWQVPSDDMLRLIAATKEFLGPIYSTEA